MLAPPDPTSTQIFDFSLEIFIFFCRFHMEATRLVRARWKPGMVDIHHTVAAREFELANVAVLPALGAEQVTAC